MVIYKITNLVNGKVYIGRTVHSLKKRWSNHVSHSKYPSDREMSYIGRALKKYGPENFKIEEIFKCKGFEELKEKEIYFINLYKSFDRKLGYNLKIESFGGSPCEYLSPETRSKISINCHRKKEKTSLENERGVRLSKSPRKNPWGCSISKDNIRYYKCFAVKEEAMEAYDKMALFLYKEFAELNYPEKRQNYLEKDLTTFYEWFVSRRKRKPKYKNVKYYKSKDTFCSRITLPCGKIMFLGPFKTEDECALIYDKIIYFLYKDKCKLNFPERVSEYVNENLEMLFNSIYSKNSTYFKLYQNQII